ncbi:amino acid/amide ABC transporter ATP-binding protein 1 (HAAT family) [Blastococcus colisei]|uniref:Amino acid/amide ABC transporter ATP-binding protein 1 (HAAT family) n=1 Tax=Blastococcus colisei TaxID=1564162 RepID=A0A543PFD4_9ACTN|nr:ABC transporter ATP-binding protein [Blastococcus colisei]TQN42776.1 amino acid/amide ABC transporter ATP-binding protein 1 (HAAT family) [Blastococcus colisei]
MSPPLLSLSGVARHFGALKAVDDVRLEVPAGARHALIGPNGAGKSTLFKLITGALPLSAGTISLAGSDISRLSEHQRARRGISQTLQHSSLFLTQTVQQNVLLAAQRRHSSRHSLVPRRQAAARERVEALLSDVGLAGRAATPVAALSHGERRQVEVAVALACEPRLLLLDEPAAGMSPAESAQLVGLLKSLPESVTLVIVEHDLDVVFALATSVTVLHLGRVLLTGTPDEVRTSEAVQEAYLGTGRESLFLDGSGAAHLEVS